MTQDEKKMAVTRGCATHCDELALGTAESRESLSKF